MKRSVCFLFLLCCAVVARAQTPTPTPTLGPTFTPAPGGVILSLLPAAQTVAVGQSFDVTIQVQAGAQPIDSAAGYLDFDPTVFHVTSITAGSTLTTILANTYSNTTGSVDYAAGLLSATTLGTFTLATVHCTAISQFSNSGVLFNYLNPRMSGSWNAGVSQTSSLVNAVVTVNTNATATPSQTPTSTSTNTPGGPTNTPTPTGISTPTPPGCCGDISTQGVVSASDVGTCLLVLAGTYPVSRYPACDCNSDGQVLADEVTQIVNNYGNGCPLTSPENPVPWAVNPSSFPGVAIGHLECRNRSGTTAMGATCLELPLLSADPPPKSTMFPNGFRDGDMWIVDNPLAPAPGVHKMCYGAGGQMLCIPFPTPTP